MRICTLGVEEDYVALGKMAKPNKMNVKVEALRK